MRLFEINSGDFSEKWGKKRGFKRALYTPPLNPPLILRPKRKA